MSVSPSVPGPGPGAQGRCVFDSRRRVARAFPLCFRSADPPSPLFFHLSVSWRFGRFSSFFALYSFVADRRIPDEEEMDDDDDEHDDDSDGVARCRLVAAIIAEKHRLGIEGI